jgi:DNA polymerase-3 subunit beta
MHGALLTVGDGKARLVSTDGRRLAVAETDLATNQTARLVLPRKGMDDLAALLSVDDAPDVVGFAQDESRAYFMIGQRRFVSRVMATKFPAYERIIPTKFEHDATVPREVWLAAMKRVMLVSNETTRKVRLVMDSEHGIANTVDHTMTLSMESQIGSSDETFSLANLNGAWNTAFDARFLADFLAAADGPQVKFEHSGGRFGAKLSSDIGGMTYTYVLMPMSDVEPVAAPQPVAASANA